MRVHWKYGLLALILLLALGMARGETAAFARGAEGEEVLRLQARLVELGFLRGNVDGKFGKQTEAALRCFQSAAHLPETGAADPETIAFLQSDAALDCAQPDVEMEMVWIPASGRRYHKRQSCSNMKEPSHVTVAEAVREGFTPCLKCYK